MRRRPKLVLGAAALGLLLAKPSWAGFKAAAAKVDITPDLARHRIYLAGYGSSGRRPAGVHDPLYARILVVSDGRLTVGVVGLDLLGFYRNDVEELRRLSGFDAPDRALFVSATHTHSGPDTMGLWGPATGVSGVDRAYHREIKEKVAARIKALLGELEEARVEGFQEALDARGLCRDSRNPVVIDPHLGALSVKSPGGRVLATVVNWSCHPEVLGSDNRLVTADFPGPLCDRLEEGLGGTCVYLSGAIGGLMTPDTRGRRENFYEAQRIGSRLAERVLVGLQRPLVRSARPTLSARSRIVRVPVENSRYLLFLPALTFGHRLLDAEGNALPGRRRYWIPLKHALMGLSEAQRPWVETEVSVLDIGPARLLGMPGEIFPELVIGGYDGRFRAGHALISPDNPAPPDLSRAPKGPYLRELMGSPLRFVVGLANDELGYIVPEYDFKIARTLSLAPRPPGHHYEETNSVGPSATGIILKAARELLAEGPTPKRR